MSAHLVQIGMRAAIRDVQDWIAGNERPDHFFTGGMTVLAEDLQAYLLAMLITAGAFEDN